MLIFEKLTLGGDSERRNVYRRRFAEMKDNCSLIFLIID